ncbi:MAG TPA: hypothetical protein VF490_13425 [Chryseosolibacter sp.]
MKSTLIGTIQYWLLVTVPFAGLYLGQAYFGGYFFAIGLIIYALVYRPVLNILRLIRIGKITKSDAWKFIVNPFRDFMYLKSIWMG